MLYGTVEIRKPSRLPANLGISHAQPLASFSPFHGLIIYLFSKFMHALEAIETGRKLSSRSKMVKISEIR